MAGKFTVFATDFLKSILQGAALPAAITGATKLYVSLHTADPGPGGTQATSEVSYSGYARVGVTKDATGWTVQAVTSGSGATTTTATGDPASNIDFPVVVATGGALTAAFACIGTAASGNGYPLWSGAIALPIALAPGVIPRLTPASVITET